MQENISLVCDTTEENVLAMFEHNPHIKQAFDNLWESQKMDEWLEKTAMPALKKVQDASTDMGELRDAMKIGVMILSLERGMNRLMAELGDLSFVDCATKAIREEEESIAKTCKEAFFEGISEIMSKELLMSLMDFIIK